MKNILVTGANGQLGQCLKSLDRSDVFNFTFVGREELDVTDSKAVIDFFNINNFDFCINASAYTAVDLAEKEEKTAQLVNVEAVKNLTNSCKQHDVVLLHVSTDFVFDGNHYKPYNEEDEVNPISVYGKTKREGEAYIESNLEKHFIIRTSWLYSEYGNNFTKTMLRLAESRNELSVVSDQIGTPTYAIDLAKALLQIITVDSNYGIYNYSNEGVASWYDFAIAIFKAKSLAVKVQPIPSEDYPTPANRPHFSVLDKAKIKENFKIAIPYWQDSLQTCIKNLKV